MPNQDAVVIIFRAWDGDRVDSFLVKVDTADPEGWETFVSNINLFFMSSKVNASASIHPGEVYQGLYDRLQAAKVPG